MSKVAIQGNASGSGVLTIAAPNTSTDRTLTLPDNTGTVLTSSSSITQNTGPAFKIQLTADQTLTSAVGTKIAFDNVIFDTNSCWDGSNYKFIPDVAGYYQVSLQAYLRHTAAGSYAQVYSVKNGSENTGYTFYRYTSNSATTYGIFNSSSLVYMNGSTDYLEFYTVLSATSPYIQAGIYSFATVGLVRAA